uniref:Uncharacterized protein n=1 Tax=Rhizophora mucronata TaxID=61149 RepID=A0A2P2PEZ7_RHIMU
MLSRTLKQDSCHTSNVSHVEME